MCRKEATQVDWLCRKEAKQVEAIGKARRGKPEPIFKRAAHFLTASRHDAKQSQSAYKRNVAEDISTAEVSGIYCAVATEAEDRSNAHR